MQYLTETERKELIKNLKWGLIYLTPFCLGVIGLLQLGEGDIIDCIYKSVQLYLMEYSVETEPLNLLTQIARVSAPIMTATFIIRTLHFMVESLRIWKRTNSPDAVAIHGDSANIDLIEEKLGKRAVVSNQAMIFRAQKHVLMFNEDVDMYRFIDKHSKALMAEKKKKKKSKTVEHREPSVFLCSEKILRGCYEDGRIVVCNVAENCARTYWETFPITMKDGVKETGSYIDEFINEKILLIGFDNYGQRLLTQGILKNVISDKSSIEYHVCGKFAPCNQNAEGDEYAGYLDTHVMMHKAVNVKKVSVNGVITDYKEREAICENQDTVFFHEETWQKVMGRMAAQGQEFDRIIICKDNEAENMEILNELKTYFVVGTCHLKYNDTEILKALWDCENEKISAFGVNRDLYDPEIILKERLFYYAKMIHARWFAKDYAYGCKGVASGGDCGNQIREELSDAATGSKTTRVKALRCLGDCMNCPVLTENWNEKNNFIRYSNVAQADHISEKIRILLGRDISRDTPNVGEKAVEAYEKLSEEEKSRLWKLEHIRWNRYHFMNNWDYAPKRDNKKRKHPLLVPYEELSPLEQSKDEDTYCSLMEILQYKGK